MSTILMVTLPPLEAAQDTAMSRDSTTPQVCRVLMDRRWDHRLRHVMVMRTRSCGGS
jgi:hypothetical protein